MQEAPPDASEEEEEKGATTENVAADVHPAPAKPEGRSKSSRRKQKKKGKQAEEPAQTKPGAGDDGEDLDKLLEELDIKLVSQEHTITAAPSAFWHS